MSVDERVILLESGFGAGTRGRNGSCVRVVPRETRVMVWKPCVEAMATEGDGAIGDSQAIAVR